MAKYLLILPNSETTSETTRSSDYYFKHSIKLLAFKIAKTHVCSLKKCIIREVSHNI